MDPDPDLSRIFSIFHDDLLSKFQRYSQDQRLGHAGWEYLWRSCPDAPLDPETRAQIFASSEPSLDPKR